MTLPSSPPASLLQHRPFVLYWNARIFASLAFQMVGVSVAWQMYAITGSAFDLGLVGLAQFLPAIVLILVAGQLADRYDRRLILPALPVGGRRGGRRAGLWFLHRLDQQAIHPHAAVLPGRRARLRVDHQSARCCRR